MPEKTDYSAFLETVESGHGRYRIIKGSGQLLPTWPGTAILTYGTQKVRGVSCLKVGLWQADRCQPLGWKVVHRATYYAYLVREDAG